MKYNAFGQPKKKSAWQKSGIPGFFKRVFESEHPNKYLIGTWHPAQVQAYRNATHLGVRRNVNNARRRNANRRNASPSRANSTRRRNASPSRANSRGGGSTSRTWRMWSKRQPSRTISGTSLSRYF